MKTMFPLVSVIVPCCHAEDAFWDTLQNICRQTYPYWEMWCIDDGAEIGREELVRSLQDERVRYVRLPYRNVSVARNYGILHADGAYIAMLDVGDEWRENHLEDALHVLEATGTDGVYGSVVLRNGDQDSLCVARARKEEESWTDFVLSAAGCGAQTSTLVMTTCSARSVLWNEDLESYQDYDFVGRYGAKFRWAVAAKPTVVCRCSFLKDTDMDYDSCIRFAERNKHDISPDVGEKYFESMLLRSFLDHADRSVVEYYRKMYREYRQVNGQELERIAREVLMEEAYGNDLSLFHGRMGMVLFFLHYARYAGNGQYEEIAESLIDDIYEDIHNAVPLDLENGLCGIGWGIEYIVQHGFIEGDTDEVLEEIDSKIMERDVRRIRDLSLETGLEGIVRYALLRLTSPYSRHAFDEDYKKALLEACRKHPGRAMDELADFLENGCCRPYAFEEVLYPMIGRNKNPRSWQNGLRQLVL